jgi:hypothetical protein
MGSDPVIGASGVITRQLGSLPIRRDPDDDPTVAANATAFNDLLGRQGPAQGPPWGHRNPSVRPSDLGRRVDSGVRVRERNKAVLLLVALLAALILTFPRGPRGHAEALESQLRKTANDLNSRQERELALSYKPEIHQPYSLVAGTSDTTKQGLRTLGLPAETTDMLAEGCSWGAGHGPGVVLGD